MTRLLVATRSRGKQAEFRELLGALPFEIVFPDDIDLAETADEDRLEVFDTFEENARAKAQWFAERSGLATLADDSGLEVDALGGAPGVLSKRFGGLNGSEHEVTAANNAKLIAALRDVPDALRTARYRCVLVLVRPDGSELVGDGATEGRIVCEPRGTNGFGYDPLFLSNELGKTFGDSSATEKAAISHRSRAVAAVCRTASPWPESCNIGGVGM